MVAQITNGVTTITPDQILVWETNTDAGAIVHDLIDGTDATLAPDRSAAGTIRCVFLDEADAVAARNALRGAGLWELSGSVLDIDMIFVRAGTMTLKLHEQTRAAWHLDIGYREVDS